MVREATDGDRDALLSLYTHLHEDSVPSDGERLRRVWARIMADPDHHLLVCDREGELVASCDCIVVSNLTRGLRPYALIENVVTRSDCRRRGYATQCLNRAREIAEAAGCYKLMLLTGAKDEATLDFYRHAGYDSAEKTGFIQRLDGTVQYCPGRPNSFSKEQKTMQTMQTQLLPVSPEALARAGEIIRGGGLVAFPTETVYGLGANALDAAAVARIFEAKGRPGDNPLIAHISRVEQLAPLIAAEPSPAAVALMDACWPGPMTLIFPRSDLVPDAVTAGLSTVAVRLPAHPVARALIDAVGLPVAAPSANRSGRPSPTSAAHVLADMDGRVPLILDGGPCEIGLESTVIDMTGPVPRILRPGGVTPRRVAEICGDVTIDDAVTRPLREGESPRSPGMKYRHYAPSGELTIVRGEANAVAVAIRRLYDEALDAGRRPLILALSSHLAAYGDRRALSLGADEVQMGRALFACLRDADALGADALYSEAVPTEGLGLAVMNRLDRAAGFRIMDV